MRMAPTPCIASAARASMRRTRACGIGLKQQLAKQHAVGAKILRVFRAPGDLGHEIGRRVVRADQLVVRHVSTFRKYSAPRISAVRILL